MKAKLRAWLIDLVREAIRSEAVQPGNTYSLVSAPTPDNPAVSRPRLKPAPSEESVHIEPSFEQMQADALKAQEKYYEPA